MPVTMKVSTNALSFFPGTLESSGQSIREVGMHKEKFGM